MAFPHFKFQLHIAKQKYNDRYIYRFTKPLSPAATQPATLFNEDRPLVYWPPRARSVVGEADLVENYDLLKEYLYTVGGSTPLPHQVHHEA